MTNAEIAADPDRILELYPDGCPDYGEMLEALTWRSMGSDAVTVGCWSCPFIIYPPGHPQHIPPK